jgi:hypothetical protein
MASRVRNEEKLAKYIRAGMEFFKREGRAPSITDWKGQNRQYWASKHGVQYPPATNVERLFGSWGNFLSVLGMTPSYHPTRLGFLAMELCRNLFGVEDLNYQTGAVDGYWHDRPVEIKGARIERDPTFGHYRWRFRLHHRQYSKLVDHIFLVGFDHGERPLIVWRFDKQDIGPLFDSRDSISIAAHPPLLSKPYPYVYNEVWKAPLTYTEVYDLLNGVTGIPYRSLEHALQSKKAKQTEEVDNGTEDR